MSSIPRDLDDPVIAMCKIGRADYMEDLVKNGVVYMNTAGFFRDLDKVDPRHDPDEGASFCTQATGATLAVEKNGKFEDIATLTGPIIHTPDDLREANLYCLHVRRESDLDKEFCLAPLKFGETAVFILDVGKFLGRVADAVHRQGRLVSYRTVEYVDRASYNGSMGLFRKFATKAAESEFRIAVMPGASGPLSLTVGPLTDITVTVEAGDVLKLTRRKDGVMTIQKKVAAA
jgi:hypothetical protein